MGAERPTADRPRRTFRIRPVMYLTAFVPVALALKLAGVSPTLVFFSSALAIVPGAAAHERGDRAAVLAVGPRHRRAC